MSARSRRGRPSQTTILPGMPDALDASPPKAQEYAALTLDEAIARAHAILDRVLAGAEVTVKKGKRKGQRRRLPAPDRTLVLFSGGGDSSIMAHLMRHRTDATVHVDTGISIPACGQYVRAVTAAWGLPLHVARPPDSYRDLVLGKVLAKAGRNAGRPVHLGFPGPAMHYLMYQRLKERALERLRTELVGPRGRPGQLVFVGGMRWAESDRRFRNADECDPWGSVVWCSPLVWWTDAHMAEYRDRYLCHDLHEHAEHRLCRPDVLPRSIVTDHLNMSGDCLCGAFARPGELDEIGLFWPEVAEELRGIQREAYAAGIERCVWGPGRDPRERAGPGSPGPLCSSRRCSRPPEFEGQHDMLDHWVDAGLMTAEQVATLRGAGV